MNIDESYVKICPVASMKGSRSVFITRKGRLDLAS